MKHPIITSLCNHRFGEQIKIASDLFATIQKIEIKRLRDITEREAVFSEIECIGNDMYKQYSPEKKLFNSTELETKVPDIPYFDTALGSFYSLWMHNHGINEVFDNPWIWQYTIKYDPKSSQKK